MASKVEIWNLALQHLRAGTVQSEHERSASRETCERFYPVCKNSVLSEGPWSFATARVALALRSESPAGSGWAYSYSLPKGFLRVWGVTSGGCPGFDLDFELQYNIIEKETDLVADTPEAVALVTMDVDESLFPPSVVMALSHLLAANLAVPLAGASVGVRFQAEQMEWYARALAAAHSIDSTNKKTPRRESRYVTSRR